MCLTSIHVTSQLHPVPENCISALSRNHLKATQNVYTCFSPSSQSCINCRSQDSCLNAIHVLSDLWQYPYINIPSSCCISPSSRCRYSHPISIQVANHLQPALIICGQPPFWFHLIPIQVEVWISPPSTSRLTSTKAPIVTSHFHPGRVSPPPMSRHLHLTSIPGMNQLFPVHGNCISALGSPYKDLQVSKCTSSFHPIPASLALRSPNSCNLPHLCTVSSVSRWLDSNLTSIHVTHALPPTRSRIWCLTSFQVACHLHPGHENCTSAPS